MKNEKITWQGVINKKSLVLKSLPSLISRIIFVLFSLYWLYRAKVVGASYLFLLMGLVFLVWSLGLFLYPLLFHSKIQYIISDRNLVIKSIFSRIEIPLHEIKEITVSRSYFDRKFDTAKIEITKSRKEFGEEYEDYFELYSIKNYKEIYDYIKKEVRYHKSGKQHPGVEEKEEIKQIKFLKKANIKKWLTDKKVLWILVGVFFIIILIILWQVGVLDKKSDTYDLGAFSDDSSISTNIENLNEFHNEAINCLKPELGKVMLDKWELYNIMPEKVRKNEDWVNYLFKKIGGNEEEYNSIIMVRYNKEITDLECFGIKNIWLITSTDSKEFEKDVDEIMEIIKKKCCS